MGLNLSFFKTPKHRVYNYQPRYYDARKEALKERVAKAEQEAAKGTDKYIPGKTIRNNFRKAIYENRKQAGSPTLMRVVILLSILALAVAMYYVAQSFGLFFSL